MTMREMGRSEENKYTVVRAVKRGSAARAHCITNRFHMMSMSGYFSANFGDSGFWKAKWTVVQKTILVYTRPSREVRKVVTIKPPQTRLYSSELHHICVA